MKTRPRSQEAEAPTLDEKLCLVRKASTRWRLFEDEPNLGDLVMGCLITPPNR
jgi:hypothetical protein